jgi:rSAM/selenodomain-associated transferase 1
VTSGTATGNITTGDITTGDIAVIVIAKSPRPGRVKTRLCPPCTPDEAATIATGALADTLTTVAATPARVRLLALDGPPGPWIPDGFAIVPQVGRDLGERLANAFAAVTGPAVLVGMDTPQITVELLERTGATLLRRDTDAVLGLAPDGGWWTIGLRRADARVFRGVAMSTDHTGADQRARLAELGYRTTIVDTVTDVDTFADARAVADLVPSSRFAAAVGAIACNEAVPG